MTIPTGPIPNVTPAYQDFSRVNPNAFHERLKTFLGVLQQREDNAIRERELRNQELARMEQAKAGELLGRMLTNMDTTNVPGMSLPSGLPGGVGPTVSMAPQTVEGPLARAVKSQPGAAIFEAMGRGGNVVSQYFSDRDKRALAAQPKPRTPVKLEFKKDDVTGKTYNYNPETGSLTEIPVRFGVSPSALGKDGTNLQLTDYTNADGQPVAFDKRTGSFVAIGGGQAVIPKGGRRSDVVSAAQFYRSSSQAWRTLQQNHFATIPAELAKNILAVKKAEGTTPFLKWVDDNVQDDQVKAALNGWTTILRDIVYQNSGKQVTVQEFRDAINRYIPTGMTGPKEWQAIISILQARLNGMYATGRLQFRDDQAAGLDIPPSPYELFNSPVQAVDPQSGQSFRSGNKYADKLQQTNPTVTTQPPAGPPPLLTPRRP